MDLSGVKATVFYMFSDAPEVLSAVDIIGFSALAVEVIGFNAFRVGPLTFQV